MHIYQLYIHQLFNNDLRNMANAINIIFYLKENLLHIYSYIYISIYIFTYLQKYVLSHIFNFNNV